MHEDPLVNNWYAIFVMTGEEDNVKERLKYRFGDSLKFVVPKRKIRERKNGVVNEVVRVLFPSYVLVQGEIEQKEMDKFKMVPGLVRLLGDGYIPRSIRPEEMRVISKLVENDELIGYSQLFEENGLIRVIDGPMVSLEGNIISIDKRKGRAKVCLYFFGNERVIDLGIELLKPIKLETN